MAEVVEEFNDWHSNYPDGYPWADWLDGQIWKLDHNDLRQCVSFDDLARYIHKKAKGMGLEVRTKRWDYDSKTKQYGCLVIQAFPKKGKKNSNRKETTIA